MHTSIQARSAMCEALSCPMWFHGTAVLGINEKAKSDPGYHKSHVNHEAYHSEPLLFIQYPALTLSVNNSDCISFCLIYQSSLEVLVSGDH